MASKNNTVSGPPSSSSSSAISPPSFRSLPLAYLPPRATAAYNANLAPNMDPNSVDFRAFYPYIPNEIKHRKRTTSAQLKVLEDVFKRDTKPNATLRKELAGRLDMPPRGVQVWFQNRRAKEKTKASKISAGKAPASASLSPSAASSDDTEISPEQDRRGSVDMSRVSVPPIARLPLRLDAESSTKSWHTSPISSPGDEGFLDNNHLLAIRRGSLPANVFPVSGTESFGPPPNDPLVRRRSVDANVRRLAYNPYANLARAKNTQTYMTRFPSSSSYSSQLDSSRPSLVHRSTAPQQMRHSSMDSRFRYSDASNSMLPSSNFHALRSSLSPYAISTRSIPSPSPGPLPAPGFSFGVATPASGDSDRNSPDSYMYRRDEDMDDEASYDGYSRFGSMASMTSESSNASANFSDVSSCGSAYDLSGEYTHRRHSCASGGQFSDMMSGLAVNANEEEGIRLTGPYSRERPTSGLLVESSLLLQGRDGEVQCESRTYPSPSPTASPSGSPHTVDASSPHVALSHSSELSYALHHSNADIDSPSFDHSPTGSESPHQSAPFFYAPDGGFTSQESSSSSGPAATAHEYTDNKFQYDEPHHYQATYPITGAFGSHEDAAGITFPPSATSSEYVAYTDAIGSAGLRGPDSSYLAYP